MQERLTVARPYAEAAFSFAGEGGQSSSWITMLMSLCSVLEEPALGTLIGNPKVTDETLLSILVEVLGEGITKEQTNFLRLLVEVNRLDVVPQILELFSKLKAESEGVISVEVISAFELTSDEREKIKNSIGSRYNKECKVESRVDLGLIGGAIIKIGDSVVDLSLRGRLAEMGNKII